MIEDYNAIPAEELVARLTRLLTVTELDRDLYQGSRLIGGKGRVFGGQVVAQALASAMRTVDPVRSVHSLHAYFMRGGDEDYPIDFRVHRDYDGRSFATRRVEALQGGVPILTLTASFQVPEEGCNHQRDTMPQVPHPEDLPSEYAFFMSVAERLPPESRALLAHRRAVELRLVDPVDPTRPVPREPVQQIWFRVVSPLADDPNLHRVALAYITDMGLLGTAVLPHAISWLGRTAKSASLDHAVWFHAQDFRADDWMLYSMDSPWAGQGRGLNRGQIFDRQGRLIASAAQEGLIRRARPAS